MDNVCSVDRCDKPIKVKGLKLCAKHYLRYTKHGSPTGGGPERYTSPTGVCIIEGCGKPHAARGYCTSHHKRFMRYGDPLGKAEPKPDTCTIEGCDKPYRANGYCSTHYQRARYHGDPHMTADALVRARNGGKRVKRYRWRTVGSKKVNGKWRSVTRLEHRVVMEEKLARPLRDNENVHHINGDTYDNRPENLELWVKTQPAGQRPQDLLAWAREIIEQYGHEYPLQPEQSAKNSGGD
jgi:hypothetical protein